MTEQSARRNIRAIVVETFVLGALVVAIAGTVSVAITVAMLLLPGIRVWRRPEGPPIAGWVALAIPATIAVVVAVHANELFRGWAGAVIGPCILLVFLAITAALPVVVGIRRTGEPAPVARVRS